MQHSWFSPMLQPSLEKRRKRRGIQGTERTRQRAGVGAGPLGLLTPCQPAMRPWWAWTGTLHCKHQRDMNSFNSLQQKKTKHGVVCPINGVQRRALDSWICSRSLPTPKVMWRQQPWGPNHAAPPWRAAKGSLIYCFWKGTKPSAHTCCSTLWQLLAAL